MPCLTASGGRRSANDTGATAGNHPRNSTIAKTSSVKSTGKAQEFEPPFDGVAVLYLKAKEPQKPQREPVDISKRYDVYCQEGNQQVVYRNALFKGVKTLFQKEDSDLWAEYLELEQADGQTVFVSRSSVIKFCEHGKTPGSEIVFSTKP